MAPSVAREIDRMLKPVALTAPQPEMRADPAAEQRADDAECNGDQTAGGIATRHQKLREGACDETEHDPVKPERHAGT